MVLAEVKVVPLRKSSDLYQLGDDFRSIGSEKQAGISVGVNPPADIASGRAHIVRWTMVLRDRNGV